VASLNCTRADPTTDFDMWRFVDRKADDVAPVINCSRVRDMMVG
jgi:hypothetical protein